MKPLLLFIALLCTQMLYAQQQPDDSTKYTRYVNMYGVQFAKLWAAKILRTPFSDTAALNAQPGAIQAGLDGNPYWWNGVKWSLLGSGGDFTPYVKYTDSLIKYVTSTQLKDSLNALRSLIPNLNDVATKQALNDSSAALRDSLALKVSIKDSATAYTTIQRLKDTATALRTAIVTASGVTTGQLTDSLNTVRDSLAGKLAKVENLKDVQNKDTARKNLNIDGNVRLIVDMQSITINPTDRVVLLKKGSSLSASHELWTLPAASSVNPGYSILVGDQGNDGWLTDYGISIKAAAGDSINGLLQTGEYAFKGWSTEFVSDGVRNWTYNGNVVPYSGATNNLNLGNYRLLGDGISVGTGIIYRDLNINLDWLLAAHTSNNEMSFTKDFVISSGNSAATQGYKYKWFTGESSIGGKLSFDGTQYTGKDSSYYCAIVNGVLSLYKLPTVASVGNADSLGHQPASYYAAASAIPVAANPTATTGLTAVNGSASTFMRSDASPALSQSITPTWTGLHVFNAGIAVPNRISIGSSSIGASLVRVIGGISTSATFGTTTSNIGGIVIDAGTYTSTGSSGTISIAGIHNYNRPTLAASTATTITNAATVYIDNSPTTSGGNVTITNPYALYIASGDVLTGGNATVTGRLSSVGGIQTGSSTAGSSNFFGAAGSSIASNNTTGLIFGTASTVYGRGWFNGNTSSSLGSSSSYANIIVGSAPITTASAGTHAIVANAVINPVGTITQVGTATISEIPTLYVNGAYGNSIGGASIYALHVAGATALSRFDGNVSVNHIQGNSGTPSITANSGAGTSPTISINGTDLSFRITLTAGTSPAAAADLFTVTFSSAYGSTPRVSVSPINANAAGMGITTYSTSATTTYKLTTTTGAALTAGQQYVWDVTITQ